MPQIELKQYTDEIARLIDDGQVDAAIEHCRHILEFYPRYLPVYRLLAQASVQKGDYAHATHFLQSLLSGDPESADAWADLAALSDDLGELEQATWLMERAFEIEPGDANIRERLRDLYKRRDGIDRPRLKLTPGALGRMYALGGFYRRAIHELQRILETRPGLPPLHTAYLEVALARAFCDAPGMEDMAERVCRSLLAKLPNCLQANLMMGHILWSQGQAEQAGKHLEIARTLDPEGRTAQELFGDRSPISFERIEIPHLEVGEEPATIIQAQPPTPPIEDTSWLDQVGQAFEVESDLSALSEPVGESEAPDWLEEWSAEQTTDQERAVERPEVPEQVQGTAPLPDWMLESLPEEADEGGDAAELPAWLSEDQEQEPQPAPDAVADDAPPAPPAGQDDEEAVALPAWLEELASEAEPADELEAVSDQPDTARWSRSSEATLPADKDVEPAGAAGELAADELPDWLKALDEQDLELGAEPEELPSEALDEELPEWMQTPTLDTEELGDEEQIEDTELPAWLQSLQRPIEGPADLSDEEEPTEVGFAALEGVELPEWLRELQEQQPGLLEDDEESLDWIAEDETEQEAETTALDREELPDWLRELRAEESAVEELAEQTPAGDGEPEAPLADQGSTEVEMLREDELPAWLQELRAQGPAPEPQPPEESTVEGELPDWLSEIEETAEAPAETAAEEELPDWLRELRAQEPITWDEEEEQAPAEEAPDWLAEIHAEQEVDLSPEAIDDVALPDWLQELQAQGPGLASEQEETVVSAPEPDASHDWVEEAEEEPSSDLEPVADLTDDELPEWLRALRAAEEEAESAPATVADASYEPPQGPEGAEPLEVAQTGAARADVELPPPVEGMPAWLSDLEAEIAGQLPEALEKAPETALEPLEVDVAAKAEEALEREVPCLAEEHALPELVSEEVEVAEEAELELAEAELELAEPEPEPLVEEPMPAPETPVEAPELSEPAPEAAVEGPVVESVPSEHTVEEELDWVAELEGAALQEEPEIDLEEPELLPSEVVVETPEPQPSPEEPQAASAAAETAAPQEHLSRARSFLAQRAIDDAAREYEQLVDTPSLHLELRQDLEQAVEANPDHPALLRVLGDVYVRVGELQKALRAYQQALHSLSQGA